ncbi:MAG TPA: alkaline phosphatase family protein [Ktedonosporobacter sp.]|nr:alkaline phosphatase family protein [Ktedonosporobacter sp.]
MLNTASLQAVQQSKFSTNFVKPLYGSYNFANIPATIEFLLRPASDRATPENTRTSSSTLPLDVFGNLPTRYDKVVLFFIDAFGWSFFERYAEKYHILKGIAADGVISKITSQFPSTTAAHTTCIHTGLDVAQSGIYEWQYFEPLVDDLITPLLFSYARDGIKRDTLLRSQVPSTAFYPQQSTLHQRLQEQGILSHVVQPQSFTPSTFSDIVLHGATIHPYKHLHEAFPLLTQLITTNTTPGYYFFYFGGIDAFCHNHGPRSQDFESMVDYCFTQMDQLFYQPMREKARNTLFMLIADHGQLEVNPQATFYLNQQIPGIERYLQTNSSGRPLVPAGSARDMFLYIRNEYVDEAIAILQKHLAGRAEIYRTQDLLAQHFFGLHEASPALLSRLGNVVILPYANETVWWYEEGVFEMHFYGHHGGLTPEEMETPLLLLPF